VLVARLDDLKAGTAYHFERPQASLVAHRPDEVASVLSAAEDAAKSGLWAVGFVAYEAAAAFDAAFTVRPPSEDDELPLARFDLFAQRVVVPGLDGGGAKHHRIEALRRRPSVWSYPDAVEEIRRRIERGDVYQVNHTDVLEGSLVGDPLDLYVSMALAQRGAYNAYFDFGDTVVASASPELFLRWDDDTLTGRPMKGTAVRGRRTLDDERTRLELMADAKQRAENVMIVDLLRNDLSRIATLGSVRVPRLFEAERYETVWQLTSTIVATTRPGVTLAEVFAATFPCGSITGAPKAAAMKVIAGLEARSRGIYCGAIGVLNPPGAGPRACFSVAIRTAVIHSATGALTYGAGAGITWSSDPLAEDAEVEAKARVLTERRPAMSLLETMFLGPDGIRHRSAHIDRVVDSATWFGFATDRADIEAALEAFAAQSNPHRVRLLLRQDGTLSVTADLLGPVPPVVRLALDSVRVRSDDVFCLHKTTNRVVYENAKARHPGVDDVILANERDEVVETTMANLLYRWSGRWYTPPLSCGGLDGVGRAQEILAGRVNERVLRVVDLVRCEALAVVSSLRGVRSAVLTFADSDPFEIDGKVVGPAYPT
jgi:para-aminobenzoate synthetase / 4-amino-4-deoxychorismate lyase